MDYLNDYLMHYGVKGMKWGVRRYSDKENSNRHNEKINTKKDSFTLKSGTTLHRATYNNDESDRKGHVFATFKAKDAKGYASRNKLFSGGKKKKHTT